MNIRANTESPIEFGNEHYGGWVVGAVAQVKLPKIMNRQDMDMSPMAL